MNHRLRSVASVLTACGFGLFAFETDGNCQTLIADLRTGVADDGTLIPKGSPDDDYVITSGPPLSGRFPRSPTVEGVGPDPDASLISSYLPYTPVVWGQYYYEVHFDVPTDAANPRIGGRAFFWDSGSVALNGVALPIDQWNFEATGWNYFVPGDNVLVFGVYANGYYPSKLEVDARVTDVSTLAVPAVYPTIQSAIDTAFDGDLVLVSAGTYVENIDFKGKSITVKSSDGPTVTTIDGGSIDSVVKFIGGESSSTRLEGFTIRNGYGYIGYCGCTHVGGGIVISEQLGLNIPSNPTITRCIIVSNNAEIGGGLYSSFSRPVITDCVIANNWASIDGGGMRIENSPFGGGAPVVSNCTFTNNGCQVNGIAGLIDVGIGTAISNCIIWNNSPAELYVGFPSTVTYSDVNGGWAGIGNIDADPSFVDVGAGDLHVLQNSPCLNTGDPVAPGMGLLDLDGNSRFVGAGVDMGAYERPVVPLVSGVTPDRDRYYGMPSLSIVGSGFTVGPPILVRVGAAFATNVVVLDDANLTCDAPIGDPGLADVGVSNAYGEGVLADGFLFTPAITIEGTPTPGGSITIHYLFDAGDSALGIWGLPPPGSYSTPPYDGDLCIVPFNVYFFLPNWPFAGFDVSATIPSDPALVGVDVLLQALVGPALTKKPKDGAWTNCATLAIR